MINYTEELNKALPQIVKLVDGSPVKSVKQLLAKTVAEQGLSTGTQAIEYLYNQYLDAKTNEHYTFALHLNLVM